MRDYSGANDFPAGGTEKTCNFVLIGVVSPFPVRAREKWFTGGPDSFLAPSKGLLTRKEESR
jgi:hypothetical protein